MKPRRKYHADPYAFMRVLCKVAPFEAADLCQIELPPRMAYQSIKDGEGTAQDYATIADALNDTIIRSEAIDPACVEVCQFAVAAMQRCRERHTRTGRYGFDGPAMQEISAALDLFSEILANSTPAQMITAGQEQRKRLNRRQVA